MISLDVAVGEEVCPVRMSRLGLRKIRAPKLDVDSYYNKFVQVWSHHSRIP